MVWVKLQTMQITSTWRLTNKAWIDQQSNICRSTLQSFLELHRTPDTNTTHKHVQSDMIRLISGQQAHLFFKLTFITACCFGSTCTYIIILWGNFFTSVWLHVNFILCQKKIFHVNDTKMEQQTGMFLASKSTILHTNYMKNTSTKHAYKKMHAKIHEKICANFWKLSVKSYWNLWNDEGQSVAFKSYFEYQSYYGEK